MIIIVILFLSSLQMQITSPPRDKNTYLVGGEDSLRHTFDNLSFSKPV